jgi:hypothetical protein
LQPHLVNMNRQPTGDRSGDLILDIERGLEFI